MNIAFYAPLKPPDHPVPSGDRQMARLLIEALRRAGHSVEIISRLRSYLPDNTAASIAKLRDEAEMEARRIAGDWRSGDRPAFWLTYHPYYRAPDFLGPKLAGDFGLPYATVEASYAAKRDRDGWSATQRAVVAAVTMASLNICFTRRDQQGLASLGSKVRTVHLPPFIDVAAYRDISEMSKRKSLRMIAVAMMRKGDKFDSYRMLAAVLPLLEDVDWQLTIIGDGPLRREVQSLFSGPSSLRIAWAGEVAPQEVAGLLAAADLYTWPGCGEAYGLAYLEAQAAGVAVVAQATAGVPEVVIDGKTGILTRAGDIDAYAAAIRNLAADRAKLATLGQQARSFVLEERGLEIAATRLDLALSELNHVG